MLTLSLPLLAAFVPPHALALRSPMITQPSVQRHHLSMTAVTSGIAPNAYQLLEQRVFNSRVSAHVQTLDIGGTIPHDANALYSNHIRQVGPLAESVRKFMAPFVLGRHALHEKHNLWVQPLLAGLYQPIDIVAIIFLIGASSNIAKLMHRAATWITPGRFDGTYEESIFPIFSSVLLNFGRVLCVLLLADAVCYTLACTGCITKHLAGAIPDVLDTVGYSMIGGLFLTRVKTHLLRKAAGIKNDQKLRGRTDIGPSWGALDRLWGTIIWCFAGAGCAKVLYLEVGFRLKSVLALGGFSSLVIGLACQTPLANIIKGLVIAASGSFAIGEKISVAGITGVVQEFGWYQSRLRLADNSVVTLPNSAIADKQIVNLSRRAAKKLESTLRLRYKDLPKLPVVIEEIRTMVSATKNLAPDMPIEVHLFEYGKTAVEVKAAIHVQSWVDDKQAKQDFLLKMAGVLDKHGVKFQPALQLSEQPY